MKKIFAAIIAIAILYSIAVPCFASENEIWEIYGDERSGSITVDNRTAAYNGVAYAVLYCQPNDASVTFIQATSYIQKFVNGNWVTMTLEDGNTQWVDYASNRYMNLSVEQALTAGRGDYRITTTFAIYFYGVGNTYKTATCYFTY
jgi:hypothetical protein